MFRSKFKVQSSRFVKCAAIAVWVIQFTGAAWAQDVRHAAEGEGKMLFYAAFNATDTKTLTDGFQKLYPKIKRVFIAPPTRS